MMVRDSLTMKNPKRLIRIQKMTPDGSRIQIDPFIGPLDLMENDGSEIEIRAVLGYWIIALKDPSQYAYLTALVGFYRQLVVNRALESGLSLPGHMARGGMGGKG